MIKHFITLEWKAFFRSASMGTNLALKILMVFLAIYFTIFFLGIGIGAYYLIKEELHLDPLITVNKYLVYYFLIDVIVRLFLQKIPVMNIRPLLNLPIQKNTIVNFSIGKTLLSFFNLLHAFFFVPFSIVLIIEGYDIMGVILWHLAIISLVYTNNFLNILLNNKDNLFAIFIGLIAVLFATQYYAIFDITAYTSVFFDGIFETKWIFILPLIVCIGLYFATFNYLKSNLYLDTGLSKTHEIAKTENLTWLNQFGTIGTFLKNDIKLIKRNKRSKSTVTMSLLFLFYGLLFLSGEVEAYNDKPSFHILAGIMVSGGFLFTFGQFVPSWDSAYYQLMMTQNISYKDYLNSKWWLIVIATSVSLILASFYLYFGWHIYLIILVCAIYNIGVNSHIVLLGGAYTKTPIDLATSKGAFGDKKAFSIKTMLLSIPKIFLPIALYQIGSFLLNDNAGLAIVAVTGIIGFAFRNKVFTLIEKVYKTEKYATIEAYKQKN